MNARFWNRFGDDYAANCLTWHRLDRPILPPGGSDWTAVWTANPDVTEFRGRRLLYYRGNGTVPGREGEHDRIGGLEIVSIGPGTLETRPLNGGRPIVDVGAEGEFDGIDVLDPATVEFDGRLWLYYSAIGPGEDSVGLAVSDDGERFEKLGRVMEGRAPEAVVKDGRVHLLYQKVATDGGYELHLAASDDARHFSDVREEPIFPREKGSWDALSLVTARVTESEGTYYMVYGGSAYLPDEPDYFGLARSTNLVDWEPHPGNPIFGCGPKGAPDGGALWFPAVLEIDEGFVMLYEGSRGKYSFDLSSAICMAWIGG